MTGRVASVTACVLAGALMALLLYGLLGRGGAPTLADDLAQGRAVTPAPVKLPLLVRGSVGPPLDDVIDAAARDGDVSLAELRGTPVILNVWASWCGPCKAESPVLRGLWKAAEPRGVLVLGLNQQDVRRTARAFVAQERLRYPSMRDGSDEASRSLGATGVPETYALDARGRIVGHRAGAISEADAQALLRAAETGRVAAP
ncbi:MAG: TlpA family protein disulfide reductase [Solirubrobacteraceae bacterium]